MRIVSMSESRPSFPPLEILLPIENSWALQVEKEEEDLCLQGMKDLPNRNSDSVQHVESSWDSCKRPNNGSNERSHRSCEREYQPCSKRASRSVDSKSDRNDKHTDSAIRTEETCRSSWYKSSSRCYPPSSLIKSSDFSLPEVKRASQFQNQRALHETGRFDRHRRMDGSFLHRKHSIKLKDGVFRTVQAVKHSQNTGERRKNRFACFDGKAEMTLVSESSERHLAHADELSHSQEHQESDRYKHKYQRPPNMHSRYRDSVKCGFSECKSRQWYAKQRGHHDHWQGVDERKKGAKCRRTSDSGMGQHEKSVHAELSSNEKPGVENDEHATAEAVIIKENALTEGFSVLESSCIEEPESKNDDCMVDKQYEMLASLLFDDLQDMDQDVDATPAVGDGPDYDCSGFIFDDDDLNTSMDIGVLTEQEEDVSGKALTECTTKHCDFNSRQASKVKSSASVHAMKPLTAHSPSCQKPFPSVLVDVTNKFEIHASPGVKGEVQEDDAHRLSQRQRQIDFGKNTLGYERYVELIPRIKRKAKDPQTPNPKQVCSKRSWDGQIRKWRRLLHVYDPPSEDGEEIAEDFSILKLHRPNLEEEKCHNAEEYTSTCIRYAEADDTKSSIAVPSRVMVDDPNLTIYDDWMES